jgi:hypothetical protein
MTALCSETKITAEQPLATSALGISIYPQSASCFPSQACILPPLINSWGHGNACLFPSRKLERLRGEIGRSELHRHFGAKRVAAFAGVSQTPA